MSDTDEIARLRALWCEEKSKSMTFYAEITCLRAELAKAEAERDRARMLFLDNHPSVISGDMDAPRVAGILGWDCFKKEAKS
jgi:hypothetical protein